MKSLVKLQYSQVQVCWSQVELMKQLRRDGKAIKGFPIADALMQYPCMGND